MVFLDNGDVLILNSTGDEDFVDNKNLATFLITNEDIDILKQKEIKMIRYSIGDASKKKSCTATNEKVIPTTLNGHFIDQKENWETIPVFNELW